MNRFRGYARGRRKPGEMNRLETDYSKFLENRKHLGEILWWEFEGIKLRLADRTFYTPDFFLMNKDLELECHETKGFWEDDARVKIKCAAEKFPFRFVAIMKKKGNWEYEMF